MRNLERNLERNQTSKGSTSGGWIVGLKILLVYRCGKVKQTFLMMFNKSRSSDESSDAHRTVFMIAAAVLP